MNPSAKKNYSFICNTFNIHLLKDELLNTLYETNIVLFIMYYNFLIIIQTMLKL